MEITRSKINKAILASIGIVGILSVALVAPNAIQLLSKIGKSKNKTRAYNIKRSFEKLKGCGYIVVMDGKVKLTDKGRKFLVKTNFRNYGKRKKWDKKFRVVIFDIPEKRKSIRHGLRKILCDVGFLRLQNSVWIYPYECSELIMLIKADLKVGKDILYLVVDQVENDKPIMQYFSLN